MRTSRQPSCRHGAHCHGSGAQPRRGRCHCASDNACNSPYSGTSWSNGQNGGTGFGAWSLFQSGGGTVSFFADTPFNNGSNCSSSGGINGACDKSWGAFANNGAIANAGRVRKL